MSAIAIPTHPDRGHNQSTAVVMQSMDTLARFASMVAKSGMGPKNMGPEAIGVAVIMGHELGLSPMQSLQSIAVINGRPGVYGDAALALVRESGLLNDFDEWFEDGKGARVESPAQFPDDLAAVCVSQRRGAKRPRATRFSVADAKRAGLWGKAGPWTNYPGRMLTFRARGFNLRDEFADVLRGFKTAEELRDFPEAGPAAADPYAVTRPDGEQGPEPGPAVENRVPMVHREEAPGEFVSEPGPAFANDYADPVLLVKIHDRLAKADKTWRAALLYVGVEEDDLPEQWVEPASAHEAGEQTSWMTQGVAIAIWAALAKPPKSRPLPPAPEPAGAAAPNS